MKAGKEVVGIALLSASSALPLDSDEKLGEAIELLSEVALAEDIVSDDEAGSLHSEELNSANSSIIMQIASLLHY